MSAPKRLKLYLDNAYIFRTSGGVESEPRTGNLLCSTGVKSRVFETTEDLRKFFEDVGAWGETLDKLVEYYSVH